jgi:23S rRNA (cytosine1962-C5)-methyltransferase
MPRPLSEDSKAYAIDRSAWNRPWAQLKYVTFQPAVFPRLLGEVSPDARPGDWVSVYDKNGDPVGAGLFNPRAKIPLRVVAHGASPIGEEYFEMAIRRAVGLRRDLFKLDLETDAYRLINSDGDGMSGLTIDRYGEVLFCEVYSLGIAQRLPKWLPLLHELAGTKFARVHVDHDLGSLEGIKPSTFNETNKAAPATVKIRENGIRYEVDFAEGHKTGFFCDQRDNRRDVARFCGGRTVLDVCCYTGGFGLYALVKGGASEVTCVDLDEKAIALAKENANANQVRPNFVHSDAFGYMRQMAVNGKTFGVVVLDPPKLIPGRLDISSGKRKYFDLNVLALNCVEPDGVLVTCSCSGLLPVEEFVILLRAAARKAGRSVQVLAVTGAAPDHPVGLEALEGAYLKAVWLRVGDRTSNPSIADDPSFDESEVDDGPDEEG